MTVRRKNIQPPRILARGALALLLGLAVLGLAVAVGRHAVSTPPSALVSHVSSMVDTADGALLEGGDPAPSAPTRAPASGCSPGPAPPSPGSR